MLRHPALPAALALLALAVHLAVPLAVLGENVDGVTGSTTVWPTDWSQREGADDAVPGGSMGYALAGLIVLVVGAAAVFVLMRWPDLARQTAVRPIAWAVIAVGTALVVHAQALWTGRGLATLVQAVLGTDGPSPHHQGEAFTPDYFAHVWAISPPIVLGLTILAFVLAVRHAPKALGAEPRGGQAYGRAAVLVVAAVTAALILPWTIHTLDDATPAGDGEQDQDPFVVSMYDALRISQDTGRIADEAGEEGLQEYTEVAFLGGPVAPAALALALLACLLGMVGSARVQSNDKVTGRTMQYFGAGAGIGVILAYALTLVFFALLLWAPNDRLADDAVPAIVPIVAALPAGMAVTTLIGILRSVAGERDTLIADDFPEPIVYD